MKFLTFTMAALLATTSLSFAQDAKDLSIQPNKTITEQNAYDYEFDREPCQGYYWGVERLGYDDVCAKDDKDMTIQKLDVLNSYVVYFGFDDDTVRADDQKILRDAAMEISQYNPSRVLVAGYTDTSGSFEYNKGLSARRADAVSDYLTDLGVSNFVVDEAAMGESNLAVQTGDDTKLQANRRVVIQFIR